ncbi:hypothetical protein LARV_00793 [Longilinea arvoryzae]|uniref:Uncharacterized protein n=1 Tax=Longilinea arvoryzae TaxID=360412 RepID=A0A0S7BGT9_9CHLR|nr:hypothetical protein [Longilinea arvoryzae]GAP13051.1 hypothetical protein LARV_00793 [Longilinea arvoryzae]
MTEESTPTIQKNPMDVLQLQASRLVEINQAQQEQIGLLKSQNEQLNLILQASAKPAGASAPTHVKIVNIDISFWDLVGFLIKLTFAWIPALLVVGIITLLISLIFGGLFGSFLGGIFGGLFNGY